MKYKSSDSWRIAFVTGSLELGGGTTFLLNLGREFVRHRHEVELFCLEENNPLREEFRDCGLAVHVAREKGEILEDRLAFILDRLIKFAPNVVVANLGAASFEVLRYAPSGVRRIGMAHADNPMVYDLMKRYAPYLDVICSVSERIAEILRENIPGKSPSIIHSPLGVPFGNRAADLARASNSPLRVIYLGRIAREQKRVHLFPEIFRELKLADVPFRLTIAGDGPEREWLQAQLSAAGLDNEVSFIGGVPYEKVGSVLHQHDVFFLASDYEGLPLSLLEAMGSGLVPVVSDLPSGIREVVKPESGILVRPDNISGYATAVADLHRDRVRLALMSDRSRASVLRCYSTQAMYERWISILGSRASCSPEWPARPAIRSIVGATFPFQFHPSMRPLRRIIKKWRAGP